jgi:transglutaminase-like putative cysteine protease
MRIRVSHRLVHDFAPPAKALIQALRLTPRSFDGQYVTSWRIEVDADGLLRQSDDAFGNISHQLSVAGPLERLVVTVTGEVETMDTAGVLRGTVERFPPMLFLRESAVARADDGLRAYAEKVAAGSGGREPLTILHALKTALHRDIAPAEPAEDTTASTCLAAGRGSPRDGAHVFIAAARHLGVPARFVSGYVWQDGTVGTEADGPRQGGPHAWAEAHVEGIGWIGFDPALDICPAGAHVRVAVGLDGIEAAPVRGSRPGAMTESAEVSLRDTGRAQSQVQAQS